MGSADDRTFKVDFSAEGVAKLSEIVRDKLKEFMGDYTDDTLVEYVIVLLRNGRDKQAARDELNVFLEEDSDSFVSWLWDHLASNLDLYVCCQESCTDEVPVVGQLGENEPDRRNSQFDCVNSDNLSRSRHKREWKGRDANKPPPPQSSAVGNISSEEKGHRRATCARSPSPQPPTHRKRIRHDEQLQRKRDTASLPTLDAPRRLLQFAVRDAVGTPRQSVMVKESPSTKRLCSIVSTPTNSPLVERPRRIQSIARVPNAMAAVARAVQEAAEDVRKVRSVVSVFDRLGCDMDASELREQVKEFRDADVEDEDYVEFNQIQEQTHLRTSYLHAGDYVQGTVNARMLDSGARFTSVSTSDDGYDDFNGIGHGVLGVSQTGPRAGNGVKNTPISQHSAAMNVDEVMPIARNKEQDIPASAPHSAYMVANSSVNANTWKPPNYQESGHVGDVVKQKSVSEIEPEVKYGGQMMTRNNSPVVAQNQSVKPPTEMQKESQKTVLSAPGLYTAGRPLDDADSRTIFVSNVHFAATKDSLSRHFNKFGDVLKVIIVTDPATGQPKGSAYVEFMQKEAADKALSLDGTSFMSRILKVVKRSSAHHDATTSIMTWPLAARGSPYATSRFPRAPFPRGISGVYRSRFPVKPGVRSMQWKRGDAKATQMESGASQSGQGLISQTARSLTYVRMESKPDGNSGTA